MITQDDHLAIICTVRYALGRQSYIVGYAYNLVKTHLKDLTNSDLKVIFRDIGDQAKYNKNNPYGDEYMEKQWFYLRHLIQKEYQSRQNNHVDKHPKSKGLLE